MSLAKAFGECACECVSPCTCLYVHPCSICQCLKLRRWQKPGEKDPGSLSQESCPEDDRKPLTQPNPPLQGLVWPLSQHPGPASITGGTHHWTTDYLAHLTVNALRGETISCSSWYP